MKVRKKYTSPCFLPSRVDSKMKSEQVVAADSFLITTVTLGCINPIITGTARVLNKFKRCVAREVIYWQSNKKTMFITA